MQIALINENLAHGGVQFQAFKMVTIVYNFADILAVWDCIVISLQKKKRT